MSADWQIKWVTLIPPMVSDGGGRSGKHGNEGLQSSQRPKVTNPIKKTKSENRISFMVRHKSYLLSALKQDATA